MTRERGGDDGREADERVLVSLRPPWTASARPLADRGLGAFVVVALATVTFDGAVETVTAAAVTQRLATVVGPFAGVVLYAVVVFSFLAAAALAARAVASAAGRHPNAGDSFADDDEVVERDGGGVERDGGIHEFSLGSRLAATLLPIAVAYDVAHNFAYVLVNATRALEQALEFVGVSVALDATSLLAPTGVWAFQVTLVLFGHVVAVVAAHVATTRAFPDAATARRGHAPLAALMVAYTVASLYVLAAP